MPLLPVVVPILVTAVLVCPRRLGDSQGTPLHKHDLERPPDEDAAMSAVRPPNLAPGGYGMPVTAQRTP